MEVESCSLNIHIGPSQNGGSCCGGKRALPVDTLSGLGKEALFRATIYGLQKPGWLLDGTKMLVFPTLPMPTLSSGGRALDLVALGSTARFPGQGKTEWRQRKPFTSARSGRHGKTFYKN